MATAMATATVPTATGMAWRRSARRLPHTIVG
jgi:hypothetical protein